VSHNTKSTLFSNYQPSTSYTTTSDTLEKRLQATIKTLDIDIASTALSECHVCKQGKQAHRPIHSSPAPQATTPLKHVHLDICGPLPVTTQDGKCYFISFVDNHSQYATIYQLHNKNEVLTSLKHYLATTPDRRRCWRL
jgi:hypothetical protein